MSLIPLFAMSAVAKKVNDYVNTLERKTVETLSYIGEEFINDARSNDTYKDRTGNLRSSIGYVVLKDGKTKKSRTEMANKDDFAAGVNRGKEMIKEMQTEYPQGFVLIVFAGMHYAAAVESRGYDVITGSSPTHSSLGRELSELLGVI